MLRTRLSLILSIAALLVTACGGGTPSNPVEATVQAVNTQSAISTQVQSTLIAQRPTPLPSVETVRLSFEVTVSGSILSSDNGSVLAGEGIFKSRGPGLEPNFSLTYHTVNFDEDVTVLHLNSHYYSRESRFDNRWNEISNSNYLNFIPLALSPFYTSQESAASQLLGLDLNPMMTGWTNLGDENLDGYQVTHYRRVSSPSFSAWNGISDNRLSVSRVTLDFWRQNETTLPQKLDTFVETSNGNLSVVIDVLGINEPVEFPSPT